MRAALADAGGVLWVDMSGASPEEVELVLTRVFAFHPLSIADCLQGVRRPKLDNYGDYIFFVVYADDQSTPLEDVNTVELDFYLGPNFVVTHHPLPLPAIDRVIEQAMQDEIPMLLGADVLASEILRAVASSYQPTVDFLSAAVAGVEVEVLTAPTSNTLHRMHELRHDLLKVRRVLAPQQEIMNRLATHELQPIALQNRLYFRELADRFGEMVDTTEKLGNSIRDTLQTHLSITFNQTNNLLRLVAAMVAFLVPTTLLALLYNMRLITIQALSLPHAGTVITGVTLLIALLLAAYVYRRGWQ